MKILKKSGKHKARNAKWKDVIRILLWRILGRIVRKAKQQEDAKEQEITAIVSASKDCTTHNLVINEIFGLTWRGIMKEIREHRAECTPPPRKYWPGKTPKGRRIWVKNRRHNKGRPKGIRSGQGKSPRTMSRRKSGKYCE